MCRHTGQRTDISCRQRDSIDSYYGDWLTYASAASLLVLMVFPPLLIMSWVLARWTIAVGRIASDIHHDFRLGARLIVRGPAFSAVAIVTLAIAIGANTAVFSVVNALLFTPLPIPSADALMRVRPGESTMSWPNYEDLRARSRAFADIAAHRNIAAALAVGDRQARLTGEATSPNYFATLGVAAAVGRTYSADDSRSDVVVVAHHVWNSQFAPIQQ